MFNILEKINTHIVKNHSFSKHKQKKLHLILENINNTNSITLMIAKSYSLYKYLSYKIPYTNLCNSYDNEYLDFMFNALCYDEYEDYENLIEYLDYISYTINIITYFKEKYLEFETNYKMGINFNIELLEILIAFDIIDNININKDDFISPQELLDNNIINNYLLCKTNDTIIYIDNINKLKMIDSYSIKYSNEFKNYVLSENFMKIFININDVIFDNYSTKFTELINDVSDNNIVDDDDDIFTELNYINYDIYHYNENDDNIDIDNNSDDEI